MSKRVPFRQFLLGAALLTSLAGWAQPISVRALPSPAPIPAVPNQLLFPAGDSAFTPFFQKMDALVFEGRQEINLVHVGGSHVQAGLLTDAIRYHMQSLAPGLAGERGFFFPFTLARTNNPPSYKVWTNHLDSWTGQRCSVPTHEGPWGVSGIRAWTRDSTVQVKIHSTEDPFQFTHLRIFAAPSDSSYGVVFGGAPDTVWYNEALQACEARYHAPQDTVAFHLYRSHSAQTYFSLEGIQVMNVDVGLRYHALGANGAATHSFLKCERYQAQLGAFPPDVIIFGLGINDAYKVAGRFDSTEFEANYDTLMQWARAVNPSCAFIFLTNNDSYYKGRYNPHGEVVARSMMRLAAKNGAAVHDFYHLMGGARSMSYWIRQGWAAKDGIHMTRAGYALQADWLAHALSDWYLERYDRPFAPEPPTLDAL
jgi:lysophospholipase L1-like esterase